MTPYEQAKDVLYFTSQRMTEPFIIVRHFCFFFLSAIASIETTCESVAIRILNFRPRYCHNKMAFSLRVLTTT